MMSRTLFGLWGRLDISYDAFDLRERFFDSRRLNFFGVDIDHRAVFLLGFDFHFAGRFGFGHRHDCVFGGVRARRCVG